MAEPFVSLKTVMDGYLKQMPEFGAPDLRPHVERVVSMFLENAKPGVALEDPKAKQEALALGLTDLANAYNMDPITLSKILDQMDQILDLLATKTATAFKAKSGQALTGDGKDLGPKLEAISTKQAAIELFVAETKKNVRFVADALKWTDQVIPKKEAAAPAPVPAPAPKKKSLFAFYDSLVEHKAAQLHAQTAPEQPEVSEPAKPDDTGATWTTENVFVPDDPNFARQLGRINMAKGFLEFYLKDPALAQQAATLTLARLENKTISDKQLLQDLIEVWQAADRQDLMSDYIVANTHADFLAFKDKFDAIASMRTVISTDRTFFSPAIEAAKAAQARAAAQSQVQPTRRPVR